MAVLADRLHRKLIGIMQPRRTIRCDLHKFDERTMLWKHVWCTKRGSAPIGTGLELGFCTAGSASLPLPCFPLLQTTPLAGDH